MSYLIRCSTLFDITATGARQRSCPVDQDPVVWALHRNQQCNFDTVVQSISIRSLPEMISVPQKLGSSRHVFGSMYSKKLSYWQFQFSVSDITVWQQDNDLLFYLLQDCQGIPMIVCGTEVKNLPRVLSTGAADRNIYFEVVAHEK